MHRFRPWVGRACMVLILLWAPLVVALDHHGAEHLSTHAHLDPGDGASVPRHLHPYQVPHTHPAAAAEVPGALPTVVAAGPAVAFALLVLATASLPALTLLLGLAAVRRVVPPFRPLRVCQLLPGPPTPPPITGPAFGERHAFALVRRT